MTRVRNLTMLTIIAFAGCGVPEPPDRIWVTVPEDAAIAAVAESLQTRGVIGSGAALISYMRMVRKTDSIKPGMYHLLPRMPIAKAAQALVAGVAPIDSITIAERATLAEIVTLRHQPVSMATGLISLNRRISFSTLGFNSFAEKYPTVLNVSPFSMTLRRSSFSGVSRGCAFISLNPSRSIKDSNCPP